MNWIAVTWGACAGICLALAGLQLLVWMRDRTLWANFWFSLSALGASATAIIELALMHAETPAETGFWIRWMHTSVTVVVLALIWFVRAYLGAGSLWLAWLSVGLRAFTLVINFLPGRANVLFREMNAPNRVEAWGEMVSVPAGVGTEWTTLVTVTSILFLVYLVGAVSAAWRQGKRRRAVVLGVALLSTFLLGMTQTRLVAVGLLPVPYTMSLLFLLVVSVIGCELGGDLVRAKQTERELRESRERLSLAAGAADLGVWDWDIVRGDIHASAPVRERLGLDEAEPLDFDRYLQSVCPEDRGVIRRAVDGAVDGAGEFEAEYRLIAPNGVTHWVAARGRVERDQHGRPRNLRGISIDITKRKEAEAESQQLRRDLSQVQRASTLGLLASALAHEINQPLGAILRNAEAAELFVRQDPPNLEEVQAILLDIRRDDQRAGAVIDRLRSLLQRSDLRCEYLALGELLNQAAELLQAELHARRVTMSIECPGDLPPVWCDRVHLQQVLLNLVLNGLDAMKDCAPELRRLTLCARRVDDETVEVALRDHGPGLPPQDAARVFEPFFSTNPKGLGMGLAISRTIIESHGGRIWAENHREGGAMFRFTLRTSEHGVVQ